MCEHEEVIVLSEHERIAEQAKTIFQWKDPYGKYNEADAVADRLHPALLPLLKQLRAEDCPEEIIAFRDEYACFGNNFQTPVVYEHIEYPSAGAAFQASKRDAPAEWRKLAQMNPELLATGNRRLMNGGKGNNDTCWGVNTITWEGDNHLGKLLMKIRDDLNKEKER